MPGSLKFTPGVLVEALGHFHSGNLAATRMSASSCGLGASREQQQQELKVHIEVLKSYWHRCLIKSSQSVGDASEISCYILLIAKLLKKDKFITQLEAGSKVHILFETAIQMQLFDHMYELLGRFHGDNLESLKESYLQFYDILLSRSFCHLFLKEKFLVPMMRTLNLCSHHSSLRIENLLLQTLHTICVALHHQAHSSRPRNCEFENVPGEIFWSICLNPRSFVQKPHLNSGDDSNPILIETECSPCEMQSICDLLVNYAHRDGSLCWWSRDSLLLLAASSTTNHNAGYYMAKKSYLCEVLVMDMVLLFNNMPRQLVSGNSADEWPSLVAGFEEQVLRDHSVQKFLDHYEFCCSILDMSNHMVKENMLSCLYRGFLLPVLAPAIQSASEPEVATTTVYFDRILWKSKGSILLPFLLRFLFSERNVPHSDSLTPQTFRHDVIQALEQSFPLSEALFYRGTSTSPSTTNANTYMDVLLKRIHCCNSLVGIATLSLLNTIVDLLCEDAIFELALKHLLLGTQPALGKTATNPSTFFASAGQYLALIPPYSSFSISRSDESISGPEGNKWHGGLNGDLSSFHVNEAVLAQLEMEVEAGVNGEMSESRKWYERMSGCLWEARKLIAERKAACGDWRFPYDLGNPSSSMALNAHMNENPLTPLPQEGLQASDDIFEDFTGGNAAKFSSNSDRNQWELDGLNQIVIEEDSILADLERFSALLREPSCSAYRAKSMHTQKTAFKFRRHHEVAPDPEEIKRTSSLYNITFVEMDPDEVTESADVGTSPSAVGMFGRMSRSTMIRQASASSTSSTLSRSVELSLTESSEQLPAGVEEIDGGDVSELMRYLDRLPGGNSVDGKSVEARFSACMRQFGGQKREDEEEQDKVRNPVKVNDSGIASVESALMNTSTVIKSSSVNSAPFYLGPLLTSLMQLVSCMPMNHLYANLQLTRLVTHLLALPLPLVRLQLLPLTAQEGTSLDGRWLYTTLMAVRQWFDCFINLHFSSPLTTTLSSGIPFVGFLDALREAVFQPPRRSLIESHVLSSPATQSPRRMFWLLSRLRLNSFSSSSTPSPSTSLSAVVSTNEFSDWRTQAMERLGGVACGKAPGTGPLKAVKDAKSRGVLMALFVFEEFCRELAALCLEHSVAL
ncbi:hypothetical protein EGR_08080 [Echinococcus granulosus]|uniref:FHF complex subunit HOOK-interacting protein C-terminal domain-containing protein n=1 Tax=Echinococcus granulosus TaxID=6210 RepID=W6U986_ECHGR|nr:hypothetical protein EGR_08080 [Echinococcus granulosus]EUB57071.1 hypothetical protein EGR_08080 [Echinococcus granulosus]